jgi:predicted nucleic acid-binding protein
LRLRLGGNPACKSAVDALLAQLCIRHDLTMLSTDQDFERVAGQYPLRIWRTPA